MGLKKQIIILESYYSAKNYERLCEPVLEISRLKKLSVILWIVLLILAIIFVIIFLIFRRKRKEKDRKDTMERVRKRIGEFKLETPEQLQGESQPETFQQLEDIEEIP